MAVMQYAFRHTPHEDLVETPTAVGTDHDQIGLKFLSSPQDHVGRIPLPDNRLNLITFKVDLYFIKVFLR